VIASDLVAAYDDGEKVDSAERWRAFSVALLELIRRLIPLAELPREIITGGLAAWGTIPVETERLADLRTSVWRHLEEKHGNSWAISDREDAVLRAALFGLAPDGDRDAAVEGAGWVEDFLTDSVG